MARVDVRCDDNVAEPGDAPAHEGHVQVKPRTPLSHIKRFSPIAVMMNAC